MTKQNITHRASFSKAEMDIANVQRNLYTNIHATEQRNYYGSMHAHSVFVSLCPVS